MCFSVCEHNIKVLIANKDIICYKKGILLFSDIFESEWQGFKYKKGTLYKRRCLLRDNYKSYTELNIGFHSYFRKNIALSYFDFGCDIVKFIIPKGSRYMINKADLVYISNQIIRVG